MRPVDKKNNLGKFSPFGKAKKELVGRLGEFCSYCERRMPFDLLAVEHIKHKDKYKKLETDWRNFLLSCPPCNTTKGTKTVNLSKSYWPQRDNTFYIYEYDPIGIINISPKLTSNQSQYAEEVLKLVGLKKPPTTLLTIDQLIVYQDRGSQRIEAFEIAEQAKNNLNLNNTIQQREAIIQTALAYGFFSIWMKVFETDIDMRKRLIQAFKVPLNCFDPITTQPISPRPGGLI